MYKKASQIFKTLSQNPILNYYSTFFQRTKRTKRHGKQIRKQIENCLSEKWPYERVSKVNIVILQIAIFEMLYLKTPYKVVINEAVELAKAFGDTKSPSFVNGVLATIVKNNQLDNKGETEE